MAEVRYMKRIYWLSCISVILLVTILITGCNKKNNDENFTSNDTVNDELSDSLTIISSGGKSEFTIVHALFGDKALTSTVNLLQQRLNNNF